MSALCQKRTLGCVGPVRIRLAELRWIKAKVHAGELASPAKLPRVIVPVLALDRRTPMLDPRNRVIRVSRFGDPEGLELVDAPLPTAGRGEVRVRVLASSLNYTEVLIRRHLYPQTMRLRPPFVMGYDVVGE